MNKKFSALMAMSIGMAMNINNPVSLQHNNGYLKPKELTKFKQKPKGIRFEFDDNYVCYALNKKNAERKHNNYLKSLGFPIRMLDFVFDNLIEMRIFLNTEYDDTHESIIQKGIEKWLTENEQKIKTNGNNQRYIFND